MLLLYFKCNKLIKFLILFEDAILNLILYFKLLYINYHIHCNLLVIIYIYQRLLLKDHKK